MVSVIYITYMRIDKHIQKSIRFEETMQKLDDENDYETIVEICMLASAHYINASLHKIGRLRIDKDIKHNVLEGFLKREKPFDNSEEVSILIGRLERLRPSHVYGSGKNGEIARVAKECYFKIKQICEGIL